MKTKPGTPQTRLSFRISAELDNALTQVSKMHYITKSDLIRRCITGDINDTTPLQQEIRDALSINRMVSIMKRNPQIPKSAISKIMEEYYEKEN